MKKTLYNVLAVASIALGAVSCVKEQEPYTPAETPSGDQVYFNKDLKTSFESNDSTLFYNEETGVWGNTLYVAVQRVVADEDHSFALKCEPDTSIAKNVFVCPESVSFAKGETVGIAEFTFDRDVLAANLDKPFSVKITIADKANVSPYGKTSVTFSVVCPDPKPWILFDTGTLIEALWGEKEVKKEMKYQQLNDTLRLCKIEGCWGHDAIESGKPYDVQPYTWIWNTVTNKCVVRPQFMGYTSTGANGGPCYVSDGAGFYDIYQGWGQSALSHADYYNWASKWLVKNVSQIGGAIPYYDGNGGFYLGDWYYYVVGGTANGYGIGFGDAADSFIGNNFTRTTDYNKDLEYEPFADGVDSSALWQTKLDIKVQVAEDPNSVEETPSQVWYIPGFVNDTTGVAFIVVASDTTSNATYSIQDAANIQYTDYDIFGKKLGLSIIARKSSIDGVPGEYPCKIELCIDANLYDVTYDEKGKPEYSLAYALGEFTDYITLTKATEVWYSADQLHGLQKAYYVDNYVLRARDYFDEGTYYTWPVSVEDAGTIQGTSYLKFKNLLPYNASLLPQNEFLVEWYQGLLYFAAGNLLGKCQYGGQELGVTLYPFSSKAENYYTDGYLLGGYYVNDEQTYECVPFVDYPGNSAPVDGFFATVEFVGGLCAYYQISMEFDTPAPSSVRKSSFVPAKYEVRTLPEVKALKANSVALKNFRAPMAVSSPAKERVVRTSSHCSHSGSIDTSRATKVEKNLTPVQIQLKNNVRF